MISITRKETLKEKTANFLGLAFVTAAIGGLATGLVVSSKNERDDYLREHPRFSRDDPALIAAHEYVPVHRVRRLWPGSPHIVTLRVPEEFLLKLKQAREAVIDGERKEVFVRHTEEVDKEVYEQYPDGSEIVLSEVEDDKS